MLTIPGTKFTDPARLNIQAAQNLLQDAIFPILAMDILCLPIHFSIAGREGSQKKRDFM